MYFIVIRHLVKNTTPCRRTSYVKILKRQGGFISVYNLFRVSHEYEIFYQVMFIVKVKKYVCVCGARSHFFLYVAFII